MKKIAVMLLAVCIILALTSCGGTKQENTTASSETAKSAVAESSTPAPTETPKPTETETPAPTEEKDQWSVEGYFSNEDQYMLSISWMKDVDEPGWYVGLLLGEDLGEDAWNGMLSAEGNSLHGTLSSSSSKDDLTVTVTTEGADGIQVVVEGGETYHFVPMDIPTASIFVTINVDGFGSIDYAAGEEAPEIDPDRPYQSAQINLAEPATHTFIALPQAGNRFVKWTKNGEDFSTEPQITVLLDESADFIAVFEEDPNWQNPVMNVIGNYQCDRASAKVECFGNEDALITITWGGSASEAAQWEIVGRFDPETLTINYSGGSKSIVTYDENGEVIDQTYEYEDGTGTIVFHNDGTFTWHDDKSEDKEDMIFEWVPVENSSSSQGE